MFCQQKMKTPARLRTGHGKSTTANVCGDFFLKKKLLEKKHQKVLMTNYTLRFKTISFEWEIVARKPDFAAVSRTHDMHRLALLL